MSYVWLSPWKDQSSLKLQVLESSVPLKLEKIW
jgi:hypothetical protein